MTTALLASIPFAAVGAIGIFELRQAFDSQPTIWRLCWRHWVPWTIVFGVWGVACFLGLDLVRDPGGLSFGKTQPPEAAMAFAAIVLAQGLRVEGPRKTDIHGSEPRPGERESYYSKALRMLMSDVYRELIDRTPDSKELRLTLRRGLLAAYPLDLITDEFVGWTHTLAEPQRDQLLEWARTVRANELASPAEKLESLVQLLLKEDLPTARGLAKRRAAAIVDRRAF